ncbi:MAG: acyltransferase family protein [Blautia massiliensis (ex Durand et al. 2017)]|nr:MAG: hypothetical protein DBX91_10570 [Subdoligranulum variabile]
MAERQSISPHREYIDILKGLGILLVVLGHFMEQYRLGSHLIGATFISIYWFHMALFCMCSGLVAHFSLRKLITQQLWLYLLGQGIMLVFRVVILREDLAASGGVLAAFLLPWRHMWYLYALLFWHLTLPVLTLLRDRLRLPGAAAGLVLAVGISLWAGTIDWPFTLVRVFAFYPFYAFGVLFRPQIDELARAAARFWAVRLVPAALLLAVYGWNFWQMMHYDGQLSESAKIFNDVAYGDGYGMPDRALFLLVGIVTSLGLVAALGGCRVFAALGRRTLPIYLLHLPILTFLVDFGFYEPARQMATPVIVAWVLLEAIGCLCILNSEPVNRAFSWLANVWYKPRKKQNG